MANCRHNDVTPIPAAPEVQGEAAAGEEAQFRQVVIIGIGGASASGKSTLSNALATATQSVTPPLSLDHYFAPRDQLPRDEKYGANWETPGGLDFDRMVQDIELIKSALGETTLPSAIQLSFGDWSLHAGIDHHREVAVVVIEGFLLFYDQRLAHLCDCRIWLDLEQDIGCRRRFHRECGCEAEEDEGYNEWYGEVVWKHYEKYRPVQMAHAQPCCCLDGTQAAGIVSDKATAHALAQITALISKKAAEAEGAAAAAAATQGAAAQNQQANTTNNSALKDDSRCSACAIH